MSDGGTGSGTTYQTSVASATVARRAGAVGAFSDIGRDFGRAAGAFDPFGRVAAVAIAAATVAATAAIGIASAAIEIETWGEPAKERADEVEENLLHRVAPKF